MKAGELCKLEHGTLYLLHYVAIKPTIANFIDVDCRLFINCINTLVILIKKRIF